MKLPVEVFLALATLCKVDGHVAPEEISALIASARACGIDPMGLLQLEAVLDHGGDLEGLAKLRLDREHATLVYAIGLWLVWADGKVTTEEHSAIERLAKILQLDDVARFAGEQTAQAFQASGGKDLGALTREMERAAAEG